MQLAHRCAIGPAAGLVVLAAASGARSVHHSGPHDTMGHSMIRIQVLVQCDVVASNALVDQCAFERMWRRVESMMMESLDQLACMRPV